LDRAAAANIDLQASGLASARALAVDPSSGHVHVAADDRLYELSPAGDVLAWRDLAPFGLSDLQGMVFAPSGDQTDDPAEMSLYLVDGDQVMEFSFIAPAALPPGTELLPATLIRTFDTSNASWDPSAPDPAGIDYWPLTNRLLIADSEVDEMPAYFKGSNVFLSTASGNLTGNCSTIDFTGEPTGVAVNPTNNHIFIASDFQDLVFEISLGGDNAYCTADDTVTQTSMAALYGVTDAEDVAYGNNTLFVAGGASAEVYVIPLGANGVLGGGDDGAMTHYDTEIWGFSDLEGIGYNPTAGTLFIVSTKRTDKYLGEIAPGGTLLRAYDLSFMDDIGNIRSDVTYAPGSQNPTTRSIYIASRGVDNDTDPNENDGKVWEISISGPGIPPAVDSIVRASTNPTSAPSVNFAVTFSEPVTGVDVNDFALTALGVSGTFVSGVSGSGTTYTVTATTGSGNGTLRLDVVDNDTILDESGNPLGGAGAGNGSFNSGESYSVFTAATFTDVPTSYWAWLWIERLYKAGITGGCASIPLQYCPEAGVTRAQMAIFLERGMNGSSFTPPPATGTAFKDVSKSYWAAAWIEQLADDGITSGCGGGNYCPENVVTRAQMAIFLLRAKHGTAYSPPAVGASTGFADVPNSYWAAAWIKQLAAEGITGGCGNGNYCPESPVTRAGMAVFLVKTFNLP